MGQTKTGCIPGIVGVGASAGGLEAFTQLLEAVPADTGLAYVLVQHLDPSHPSYLAEALAKVTVMAVKQIEDGDTVLANNVYVMPPNNEITIVDGCLRLSARQDVSRKAHLPIDTFFTSLADACGPAAIGIVLSGNASDGTAGLRAIKSRDGITLVQDPTDAKFDGMPRSAIDAGVADYTLPIPELAATLARLAHHARDMETDDTQIDTQMRDSIIAVLHRTSGVDFSEYKDATFQRRLARRMALRNVASLRDYVTLLETDRREAEQLHEEILIHVTSFFRDPPTFTSLSETTFPAMVTQKAAGEAIRVWVAGCATGEEVYSIAIALLEVVDRMTRHNPVQIFASDISDAVIRKARIGTFSDNAMKDVSEGRRERYFTKTDGGFRINKAVRDLCVFVHHDLTKDPPFSKLDLIACRNVLIYFDQSLQKRVLPIFHYALNPHGFLVLGRTENVAGFTSLFLPADKANKIFARGESASPLHFAPRSENPPSALQPFRNVGVSPSRAVDIGGHVDRLLLAHYAPPGVVVNARLEILQFRGETGAYLQPAPGKPQTNFVKMARPGLAAVVRAAVLQAKAEGESVRTNAIHVEHATGTTLCDVVVTPITDVRDSTDRSFLVLFEHCKESRDSSTVPAPANSQEDMRRSRSLELELAATRDYLQAMVDDQDRANDELNVANEELISSNEELQSLNEELETAKEELQSTNEELITVNEEMQNRNQEMTDLNGDLINVFSTVDVPIIILDANRHIRRFTPKARNLFSLVAADIGRSIDDIKSQIPTDGLDAHISDVIATNTLHEAEVQDRAGAWYRMQIRPYKTVDGKIDGVTLSLVDIDTLKHLVGDAQAAKIEAERANRAKDEFLATLSHEIRTPLFTMLMHAQSLSHGTTKVEKVKSAAEAIERGIMTQVKIIDDLLDVSRIIAGKLRVEHKPLDIESVVRAAIESVTAQAEKKSIKVDLQVEPITGIVSGDNVRLQQVVVNLLANAIKFSPAKSRIVTSLDIVNNFVRLRVRDNGCGIEEEFLPRVFSRFSQEDGTTERRHGGLGLGLAIVRHLVEAHGGSVHAESAGRSRGSMFSVLLPLEAVVHDVEEAPRTSAQSQEPLSYRGTLKGIRAVVVDDDAAACEVVAELLKEMGASVRVADSTKAAVIAVESFRPDILLSDIAMPDEDGFSLIRRIKELGPERGGGNLPALALTAFAGEDATRRSLDAGFKMHIEKPVDITRLQHCVVELAGRGVELRK